MDPEVTLSTPPSIPPTAPDSGGFDKRLLVIAVAIIVVIVLAVVSFLSHPKTPAGTIGTNTPGKFSLTGTDPTLVAVTTLTPTMAVHFSMPIQAGSAVVTSSPQIIASTSISGSTLTLIFTPKTFLNAKTYSVTITSIRSTTGVVLTNQKLSFVTTFAPPNATGQTALTNIGLSDDQVSSIYTYISQFDPWAASVVVDESTIRHYRENPSDAWSPWAVSFNVNVDGTVYKAVSDYNNTEHIRLTLAAGGPVLFTAGDPGSF